MSKIDNLKLRDVEILSDSQLRSGTNGSSGDNGFYSGYNGSSDHKNGSSGGDSASGSNRYPDGFGFTPEKCMPQEVYYEMIDNGITVTGVYVCGLGWAMPGGTGIGSFTGSGSYRPDDFGSFGPMGSFGPLGSPFWSFGSSAFGSDSQAGGGGGGGLPNPSIPSETDKVKIPPELLPLFRSNRNLNSTEMAQLKKEFEKMLEDCGYAAIQEYLSSKNVKYNEILMDKDSAYPIDIDVANNNLEFKDLEAIKSESLSHEMIHLLQNDLGLYDSNKRLLFEGERALIMDVLFFARYAKAKVKPEDPWISNEVWYETHYAVITNGAEEKVDKEYRDWLVEITKNGIPDSIEKSKLEWAFDLFEKYSRYGDKEKHIKDKTYSYAALKKTLEIVGDKCKKGNVKK